MARRAENPPPFPFLLFFGTRSSLAKLAIFFIRACAAALFLSLRAAFLLALSFILLIIAYIPGETMHDPDTMHPPRGVSSIRLPKIAGRVLCLRLLSAHPPLVPLFRVVFHSELSYEPPSPLSVAFVFASP